LEKEKPLFKEYFAKFDYKKLFLLQFKGLLGLSQAELSEMFLDFNNSCRVLWHLLQANIAFPHEGQNNSSFCRRSKKL
jgi:hypothetical protein